MIETLLKNNLNIMESLKGKDEGKFTIFASKSRVLNKIEIYLNDKAK